MIIKNKPTTPVVNVLDKGVKKDGNVVENSIGRAIGDAAKEAIKILKEINDKK